MRFFVGFLFVWILSMVILALPWSWLDSSFGEKAPWWSFLIVSLIVSGVLALGLKMDDLYDKTEIWLVDILFGVRDLRLEQARELLSRYEESGMTGEELKEKRLEEFKESTIRILDDLIEEKKDELARIQKGKRRQIKEKMDELRRKRKENIQRIEEELDKLDKLDKIAGRLIEDEEKESRKKQREIRRSDKAKSAPKRSRKKSKKRIEK